MAMSVAAKRREPFPFVLAELEPLRPVVRRMFGCTYVYLDERLLMTLWDRAERPRFRGIWLYTQTEHIESLRREFPQLPRHRFWRSGRNAWIILAAKSEEFEEYALRACALILGGDRRIGRVTRKRLAVSS